VPLPGATALPLDEGCFKMSILGPSAPTERHAERSVPHTGGRMCCNISKTVRFQQLYTTTALILGQKGTAQESQPDSQAHTKMLKGAKKQVKRLRPENTAYEVGTGTEVQVGCALCVVPPPRTIPRLFFLFSPTPRSSKPRVCICPAERGAGRRPCAAADAQLGDFVLVRETWCLVPWFGMFLY
jgi:hypothetical protein